MKIQKILHSRKGFTLIELIIGMTIFGVMSIMATLIYFNISENSRRLQISREITETARQITERLTQEIQENKIFIATDVYGFNKENFLGIGKDKEEKVLIFAKKNPTTNTISPCEDSDKINPEQHCGLYLRTEIEGSSPISYEYFNLVDAFVANELEKRVKISDLKFDISGEESDIKKVTMKMTISLTKKSGVPNSLIQGTKTEIQTTISERIYK